MPVFLAVGVIEPSVFESSREAIRGPLPGKFRASDLGLSLGWRYGALGFLAVLACFSEVRCGVGVPQIQFKMVN